MRVAPHKISPAPPAPCTACSLTSDVINRARAAVVTEDADLPGTLKRDLTQLRELDAQSQELFERMSKLSKNHILRAKKAVQEGREPDEEYLVKARKAYKELMELDEEKLALAEQMHTDVARHFDFCSSELRKFEEELKEKGQLKTPQMKTQQLSRQDSAGSMGEEGGGASASASASAAAIAALPPVAAGDGRRGRTNSIGGLGDVPAVSSQPSSGGNSHKRGRGRKVSFKEAERQRQQAEAMEQRQQAAQERAGGGGASELSPAANAPAFNYPDPVLPLAPREESNLPLCGAVPAAVNYIIPERSKVCAKPPSVKMQPQDWILGTVLKYVPAANKYVVVDEDDSDADPWAAKVEKTQHQVPARMVLPLPLTEPSMYTQYNEFSRGVWVLALYPDTTCFYKALVHTPPSQMAGAAPKDYLVEFEDDSEASGKGEPMRVPTKYVLRLSQ